MGRSRRSHAENLGRFAAPKQVCMEPKRAECCKGKVLAAKSPFTRHNSLLAGPTRFASGNFFTISYTIFVLGVFVATGRIA